MKAWKLFKSKENWCKGWFALSKEKMNVSANSPDAIKWCAVGALRKAYNQDTLVYFEMERKLHNYVDLKTRFDEIAKWNDHENQRWGRVKAVLKRLDI